VNTIVRAVYKHCHRVKDGGAVGGSGSDSSDGGVSGGGQS